MPCPTVVFSLIGVGGKAIDFENRYGGGVGVPPSSDEETYPPPTPPAFPLVSMFVRLAGMVAVMLSW